MRPSQIIWILILLLNASSSILNDSDTYYEPTYSEIYDQTLIVQQKNVIKQNIKLKSRNRKKKSLVKTSKALKQTSQPIIPQPNLLTSPPTYYPPTPAKPLPCNPHLSSRFASLYLFGSLLLSLLCWHCNPCMIFLPGYLIYLFIALTKTSTLGYISNTHPLQHLNTIFTNYTQSAPYFMFTIECYHYERVKRNKKRKVVTYEKEEKWEPQKWESMNGWLEPLREIKEYVFIQFVKKSRVEAKGRVNLDRAWQRFLQTNVRDKYQKHNRKMAIQNFQREVGFVEDTAKPFSRIWATFFAVIGLDYPYNLYVESYVRRYKIEIKKKIIQ